MGKNKIIKKRYYRIDFKLKSALSLGGNESFATDKDIICNGNGIPYIPASSLAGIYRSFYSDAIADEYFGSKKDFSDSKIFVYDAELKNNQYTVSKRDCVAIDNFKTAIAGAKFDFEVLDAEAEFVTYLEQNIYDNDDNVADATAEMWAENKIRIGGKTTRGLGQVKTKEIRLIEFSLKEDKENWLDFDIYDDLCWNDAIIWNSDRDIQKHWTENSTNEKIKLILSLKQVSPVTVRVYTSDVGDADYKQLTCTRFNGDKREAIPVIPGTSWAGVFKHNIKNLNLCDTDKIFGNCGKNTTKKSSIYFSETVLENGKAKTLSRNAIDRFSGGTVENALFTEQVYYGGEGTLEIELNKADCDENFYKALVISILDLNEGIISVGGEASVGHGLFKLKKIKCNDKEIAINDNANDFYKELLGVILDERGAINDK